MEEEPGEQIDECSNMYARNMKCDSSREEAVREIMVMPKMGGISRGRAAGPEGGAGSVVTEDSSNYIIHHHQLVINGDSSGSNMQYLDSNLYTREATGARTIRQTGGKDRHSKVYTSKGPRDRRVRLSVSTAIQFYDLQDRLGYDQPSKAVEWLILKAKPAIDRLPLLRFPHLHQYNSPPPPYNPSPLLGPNASADADRGPRPRPRRTPRSPALRPRCDLDTAPVPAPPPGPALPTPPSASSPHPPHSPPSSLSLSGLDSPEPTTSAPSPRPSLCTSSPAAWDRESHTTHPDHTCFDSASIAHLGFPTTPPAATATTTATATATLTHRPFTKYPTSLSDGGHAFHMQKPSAMPHYCRKRPKSSDNDDDDGGGDDNDDNDDDDDDDEHDQELERYLEQNFTSKQIDSSASCTNPTISFLNNISAATNQSIQTSNSNLLQDQWSTSLITQLMDEAPPSSSHYLKDNDQLSLQLNQNLSSPSIASNLMSGCNQSDVQFIPLLQYATPLQMNSNPCDMASNLRSEEMNTSSCAANTVKQVDYVDNTSRLTADSSNTSFPASVPASYHSIDLYNTFEEAGPSFARPSSSMPFPYSPHSTTQIPADMHHVFPATRSQIVPSFMNTSHPHHFGNFHPRLHGFDQQL